MPRKPPLARRTLTAARWPPGVALTLWRYLWRITPLHRTEEVGNLALDAPPALHPDVSDEEIQFATDGSGPLFHRRYRIRIRDTDHTPESFISMVCEKPDHIAPTEFASFQKVLGDDDCMNLGDEYYVRMPGPWDGPVRVVHRGPHHFRLATLTDHLEAGQIEFRAREEDGLLVFEIESWARSGDRFANVMYHYLRISKETQLHMWISTLERAAKRTGGRMTGGIDIHTRRVE